ncbi:hypothetical protein Gpo141_00002533 [Globisporangium polare]
MALKRPAAAASATDDDTANTKRSRGEQLTTSSSSSATTCVAQLPQNVFTHILALAVPGFVPAAQCVPWRPNLPIRKLRVMALVSEDWLSAVQGVVREFVSNVFQLKLLTPPSQDEFEELLSEIAKRGDQLLDLRVVIDANLKPKHLELVDWDVLLGKCPKLQRLDLQHVPLEHSSLAQILNGAATNCSEIEALILSERSLSARSTKKAIVGTYDALYEALSRWNDSGTSRLRQLTIPNRLDDDAVTPTSRFLSAISESCPALECLDGWQAAYKVEDFVECDEKWYISLSVWRRFCETTGASLREFNWAVAPFHEEYFQLFAADCKPKLRKLTLTVSESWSWDDFKFQDEQQQQDEEQEEGQGGLPDELVAPPAPETLSMVAKAVPNVEQLHVILHSNMEEPSSLDADAFGDEFLIAVADSCRSLNELKLVEIDAGQEIAPISTISSAGILALSKLECLERVVITGVEGTSLGTFAFVKHWRSTKSQRTVDIGIDQGESGRAFYDEALDLLTSILGTDDEDGQLEDENQAPPKFAIKVRNLSTEPDFRNKNLKNFCKEWNKLVKEIKTKRSWLRVAIEADGVLEEDTSVSAFSTIGRIELSSESANLAVFDELNALMPSTTTPAGASAATSKSVADPVKDTRPGTQSSSQEELSSENSESDSGYGSVVDEESESSASEASDSEPEEEYKDIRKRKRRVPVVKRKAPPKRAGLVVVDSEDESDAEDDNSVEEEDSD